MGGGIGEIAAAALAAEAAAAAGAGGGAALAAMAPAAAGAGAGLGASAVPAAAGMGSYGSSLIGPAISASPEVAAFSSGLSPTLGGSMLGSALPSSMMGGAAAPSFGALGFGAGPATFGGAKGGLSALGAQDMMRLGGNMTKMGQPENEKQSPPMVMPPMIQPPQVLPFTSLNPYTRGGRKVY